MNLPKKPNLNLPFDLSYYGIFSDYEQKIFDQGRWNEDVSKVNNYATQVEKVYNKQNDEISGLKSSIAKQNATISSQKNEINTIKIVLIIMLILIFLIKHLLLVLYL